MQYLYLKTEIRINRNLSPEAHSSFHSSFWRESSVPPHHNQEQLCHLTPERNQIESWIRTIPQQKDNFIRVCSLTHDFTSLDIILAVGTSHTSDTAMKSPKEDILSEPAGVERVNKIRSIRVYLYSTFHSGKTIVLSPQSTQRVINKNRKGWRHRNKTHN